MMENKSFAMRGKMVDICAELEKEAERCKGMTVGGWLKLRELENELSKQFDCSEEEIRDLGKKY